MLLDEFDDDADETTDAAEVQAAENPGPDLLNPHQLQWSLVEEIIIAPDISTARARLEWPDGAQRGDIRTEMEYFKLLYPMEHIPETLRLTNASLRPNHAPLTKQELFVFIGLMIGVAANPAYTIKQLFGVEAMNSRIRKCPDFSDLMSYQRYSAISSHLIFATPPEAGSEEAQHGFWAVQPLIDAFNANRSQTVIPGSKLCVDESMTKWKTAVIIANGVPIPCIVKMKAKPEPVGMMTKNIACAETGIMLRLEMVTNPEESRRKEFNDRVPAGTGYLLRLSRPWWASNRHIVADAGFASATAAVELRRKGLHFTGIVKGAHRLFPKRYLETREYDHRGSHKACTATKDNVALRAIGWNEGKADGSGRIKPKTYISTCGTTVDGPPHLKRRYARYQVRGSQVMREYTVPVPRPELVSSYYDGAQAIDVHNHLARTTLGLEQRKTSRYAFRYFQTFVRFVVTDVFLAFKKFTGQPNLKFEHFRDRLAEVLFDNTEGAPVGSGPLRRNRGALVADGGNGEVERERHGIAHLKDAAYYVQKRQNLDSPRANWRLTCRICKRQTSYYCPSCTTDDSRPARIYAICSPTVKDCFERAHLPPDNAAEPPRAIRRVNDPDSATDSD